MYKHKDGSYKKRFETRQLTADKRSNQVCKTFTLKIRENKLNKEQRDYLYRIFLEGKWFYNHILSTDDVFKFDTKINTVDVLNKDKVLENRDLTILSSQLKQELHKRIITSIKALSTKKKNGKSKEVGRLKFKSEVNSIPFKQYNNSHKISGGKLKLTKCKSPFKVSGLNQLDGYEVTSGNLYKDATGYYFKIACFRNKNKENITKSREIIGIDFGITDDLTLSNGMKFKTKFPVTKSIKRNQRRLSKKTKGSKNYLKQKLKLRKSYKNYTNKKTDAKNKIVSYLKNNYSIISVQDENIKGWHSGLFGRQIQMSMIGGIISEIKRFPQTLVVDRFFPSTQLCPECGTLNKHSLKERIYRCDCGYEKDRDVHAALNILRESLLNNEDLPMERRDFKPVELITSVPDSLLNCGISVDYEPGSFDSLELK